MEEVKYSRSEVMMLLTLLVLVIPYIWMAMRKVYSEWTRISMIGKVRQGTYQQQLQELHFSPHQLPLRARKSKARVFHSSHV